MITAEGAAAKPATAPRQVVKEWKMDDLLPALDRVGKGRNFQRGREAFAIAQCLACHRFGNEGGSSGPDITAVSSRFTRADILSSIIEPSKVISEQYQNMTITKKGGEEVTGRIVEENDERIVVRLNPLTSDTIQVQKNQVQDRQASKISPMPEGLVNVLRPEEILDLLAYIESGGKATATAFNAGN